LNSRAFALSQRMPRLMSWIEPGCGATGGMRKSIEATKMPLSASAFAMKSLSVRSLLVQAPPCTCSAAGNGPAPLGR
jgi:hypothetical protein